MKLSANRFRPASLTFPLACQQSLQVEGQAKLEAEYLPSLPDFWKLVPGSARWQGCVQKGGCFFVQGDVCLAPWERCLCGYAHDKPAVFGNLLEHGLYAVWNNERYRAARRLFAHHWAEKIGLVCDNYRLFERRKWKV